MTIADSEPVKKVRNALKDAGLADNVVEFDADGKRRRHRQGPGYGTGRVLAWISKIFLPWACGPAGRW